MHRRAIDAGGVGHAIAGETHEIEYVDLPPICAQPKGKPLPAVFFTRP
jgi:hypothetical protein